MATVEIVDRSAMVNRLKGDLTLDPKKTAIITIDMHRGHLDPKVATMPCSEEDCRKVIRNTLRLLEIGRTYEVPIIHVKLVQRKIPGLGAEGMNVPFWRALHNITEEKNRLSPGRRSTVDDHNIEGSVQTEMIPELVGKGDYLIENKKRLNCFYGTDLEELLRVLGVDTTVFIGINTNTCDLDTAFAAFDMDYRVIVISDCVASMYGEDLHLLALQNISRCLGWVLTVDEFAAKLERAKAASA